MAKEKLIDRLKKMTESTDNFLVNEFDVNNELVSCDIFSSYEELTKHLTELKSYYIQQEEEFRIIVYELVNGNWEEIRIIEGTKANE